MNMTETRISRHLNAPCSQVYRALIDARAIATWMVPDGMSSQVHHLDAREGGRLHVTLTYDAADGAGKTTAHSDSYHGCFLRLIPDQQVVELIEFETNDPSMRGEMTITFTLVAAQGGTELTAVHSDLPRGMSPTDNDPGWRMSLDKLATYVEASPYR
jgi:uncharacterized protein YndB with AHSA1/START domain